MLEPLATAVDGSSELVSGEDLKSNIDKLNMTNTNWVPEANITTSVIDMEGAVESDNIPKLCGCDQGKCDLYEEEENNTPDKTSDENIPTGWKQGPVPVRDENIPTGWKQEEVPTRDESGDDSDGDQDLSKLSEEQRDLSESLPRSSGSSKPSSRESKAKKMRARRASFKEARKTRSCRKQPPIEVKMMNSCEAPNNIV